MKSHTLVYLNGHFYDQFTRERVALADNQPYVVVGEVGHFRANTPIGIKVSEPLPELEIEASLLLKIFDGKIKRYHLLLEAGNKLYFQIRCSVEGSANFGDFLFEVELLEALFAYLPTGKAGYPRVFDCACQIVNMVGDNQLKYFEPVYGKSLNDLYKSTYVHYFWNLGNPASNALNRFYLDMQLQGMRVKDLIETKKWEKEESDPAT